MSDAAPDRVVPAQQRLEAHDLLHGPTDDRLIEDLEFPARQGLAQIECELMARLGAPARESAAVSF